ncbi:hypothetical protein [Marinobacter sp. JSM 1782161]|uniref:hypothetical protein n=1 Tax=Marinobacter sp. JSM 1782161 TaxID=2685906 RepID=UPI001401DB1A|nr:hypothetical protein [Marinobacter sp. JSM 1782161]
MKRDEFEVYKPRHLRLEEHLPKSDDATLITLKGHLLVEEILEEIILHYCRAPEVLSGVEIAYFLKLRLAQALIGPKGAPDFVWEMAGALNSLRNELSHKLDSPKVAGKLDRFIGIYRSRYGRDTKMDKASELRVAIGFILGALTFIETKVKTGRMPPALDEGDV